MSAPMIGDAPLRFAEYDLVRFLGRGGMGEVWSAVKRWQLGGRKLSVASSLVPHSERLLADPLALNKPLAVKVMHPTLSEDDDYRRMFLTESCITMQLSGSNIVPVFEVGEHEGLLYMTMERVDGVNLFDFQQRVLTAGGLMPLDISVRILHELLFALFVAHEHIVAGGQSGFIHRDVKPGNVLISSVGDVRLTDFGIARRLSGGPNDRLPQGTPRYMAPEQMRGFATAASDLFAVGAIFHELLTGRRFRDECRSTDDLADTPWVVPPLDREIPPELEYVRRRLLDPDPARRFASAREALSALSSWKGYSDNSDTRIKTADLYEKVIGSRSSGFTRTHTSALPSFLVQHRFGIESALTLPRIRRSEAGPPPKPSALVHSEVAEDDDTLTFDRMPWLEPSSQPSGSPASGPETNAPRSPRPHREVAVHHPAASPPELVRPSAEHPSSPPVSNDRSASVAAPARSRPPSLTPRVGPDVGFSRPPPTEILAPPFASVAPSVPDSNLDSAQGIDRTEPQPPPILSGEAHPQARPSPRDRDRYAAAGVLEPVEQPPGAAPRRPRHPTAPMPTRDTIEAPPQRAAVKSAAPIVLPATRGASAARIATACVIAAAIFVAGIATAFLLQGTPRAHAPTSEERR